MCCLKLSCRHWHWCKLFCLETGDFLLGFFIINCSVCNLRIFYQGRARPKKMQFFCFKFSKKGLKTLFLTCFSKFCLGRSKFGQNRDFLVLWESSKSIWSIYKNSHTKFSIFLNPPPPPSTNPRSATVHSIEVWIFTFMHRIAIAFK